MEPCNEHHSLHCYILIVHNGTISFQYKCPREYLIGLTPQTLKNIRTQINQLSLPAQQTTKATILIKYLVKKDIIIFLL